MTTFIKIFTLKCLAMLLEKNALKFSSLNIKNNKQLRDNIVLH